VIAASAAMGAKLYIAGGASGHPTACPPFTYYNSLWVFDPQGGEYPRIRRCSRPSNDTVRLVWQGEPGRLCSVESSPEVAPQPRWPIVTLSAGATVLATNDVVEAMVTIPSTDKVRCFRVVEAD
jgi:hypothetical protein